ncbi:MAG: NACHT domain-containing protein [Proteobacteria bacterium]|nr:MAG: NACHT domain-containing protein [Pseudomonadota bacterium]
MNDFESYELLITLGTTLIPALSVLKSKAGDAVDLILIERKLRSYLKRTYNANATVPAIADPNRKRRLDDIYVPLTLVSKRDRSQKRLDVLDQSFILSNPKMLIVDSAGMGKSTALRWMLLRAIEQTSIFPILVDLRRLDANTSIFQFIRAELNSFDDKISDDTIIELLNAGDFFFLLDGYDEIPSNEKSKVTREIMSFSSRVNKSSFVMTSRPDPALASFTEFEEFKLLGLTKNEAYELIRKFGGRNKKTDRLIKELNAPINRSIHEFLANPLLVSLLFIAYDYKQSIPLKRTVFFEQVFDALFDRHDFSKGDSYTRLKVSGLGKTELEWVLSRIAIKSAKEMGKVIYSSSEFEHLLRFGLCETGLVCKVDALAEDLTSTVPVIVRDGAYYRWAHKSFQDYFAAVWLKKHSDGKAEKFLELVAMKDVSKYGLVLELFSELDRHKFKRFFVKPILEEFLDYAAKVRENSELTRSLGENLNRFIELSFCRSNALVCVPEAESRPMSDMDSYALARPPAGFRKAGHYAVSRINPKWFFFTAEWKYRLELEILRRQKFEFFAETSPRAEVVSKLKRIETGDPVSLELSDTTAHSDDIFEIFSQLVRGNVRSNIDILKAQIYHEQICEEISVSSEFDSLI